MPSLGNLFTAIGRMLPGFYEGERQAIKDNWDDLKNYNDVQAGQFENAWTAATWRPRLTNVWYNTVNNAMALEKSMRNNALDWQRFPGQMDYEATLGALGGQLAALQAQRAGLNQATARQSQPVNQPYYGYGYPLRGLTYPQEEVQRSQQQAQGTRPSGV